MSAPGCSFTLLGPMTCAGRPQIGQISQALGLTHEAVIGVIDSVLADPAHRLHLAEFTAPSPHFHTQYAAVLLRPRLGRGYHAEMLCQDTAGRIYGRESRLGRLDAAALARVLAETPPGMLSVGPGPAALSLDRTRASTGACSTDDLDNVRAMTQSAMSALISVASSRNGVGQARDWVNRMLSSIVYTDALPRELPRSLVARLDLDVVWALRYAQGYFDWDDYTWLVAMPAMSDVRPRRARAPGALIVERRLRAVEQHPWLLHATETHPLYFSAVRARGADGPGHEGVIYLDRLCAALWASVEAQGSSQRLVADLRETCLRHGIGLQAFDWVDSCFLRLAGPYHSGAGLYALFLKQTRPALAGSGALSAALANRDLAKSLAETYGPAARDLRHAGDPRA